MPYLFDYDFKLHRGNKYPTYSTMTLKYIEAIICPTYLSKTFNYIETILCPTYSTTKFELH